MVGYVMVIYDYDIPEYDIWHMMIDASGKGRENPPMRTAVSDFFLTSRSNAAALIRNMVFPVV